VSEDEFILAKYLSDNFKIDIRNEEEKLSDNFFNSTKLLVQLGKPLHGVTPCKFILYDIINESKTDLFEFPVPSKNTLLEVKSQIVKHFTELQSSEKTKKQYSFNFPTDPEQLRIRTVHGIRPSTVHPNSKLLKDIITRYQNPPEIFVQILPENQKEDKITDEHLVLILRQFYPDKYELGNVIEITVHKDEKIIDIKSRIADIIGIPLEQLTLATAESWDIQNILLLPKLAWYPRPQEDKKDKYNKYTDILDPNKPIRSLTLEDSNILLCRDLLVPRKILTTAEERKIMEDEEKKRMMKMRSTYNRIEERLDIKIADVSIIDTSPQKKDLNKLH